MHSSSSGTRIGLKAGPYEAHVVTVGAGIASLTVDGLSLTHPHGDDKFARGYMGKTLLPWPNRIAGGVYEGDGEEQQLPINDVEHHAALHGLMAWENWQIVDRQENAVALRALVAPRPGYPWTLEATVRVELHEINGLTFNLVTTNIGSGNAPYGAASHPYISFDGAPVDGYEIEVPANHAMEVDENLTPVGLRPVDELDVNFTKPRVLGKAVLDHAFTDLPEGKWSIRVKDISSGRSARLTSNTNWVQLYSGEEINRTGLAVEPMTCAPNAFNNKMGLTWLKSGQSHVFSYSLRED